MAEPFTPEQLTQIRELLETVPLASTLLEIAQLLGFETWEPGDQAAESLDFLIQSEVDTQGLVRDLHTPNRPWITTLLADIAAIKAKVDANLPVPPYPTPPTAAINAAAVWDVVLQTSWQANFTYTARQIMSRLGHQSEWIEARGFLPVRDNPDYIVGAMSDTRFTGSAAQWDVTELRPRERPAGETILAYHQRVQPTAGWQAWGTIVLKYIKSPTNTIVAWLACTLQDVPPDKHPATPAAPTDPLLTDASRRLRQYLPLPGEGTAGAGVAISGEGQIALSPTAAQVTIDLVGIPIGSGHLADDSRWYATLGIVAFLRSGEFDDGRPIHREGNWLHVPPGATGLWYWLRPGITATLTVITVSA